MRRNFNGGCRVSYEEFLKIKENIENQSIPEPLIKVVEYATRKILYDKEAQQNNVIVVEKIVYAEQKPKFSKLKAFLKRKKQNQDLEINL